MTKTLQEKAATDAMENARRAALEAVRLAEEAGYGPQISSALADALSELHYAQDTAEGQRHDGPR